MIKSIVFDMDGTMCDTLSLAAECFQVAIGKLSGKTVTREEIEQTYGANEIATLIMFLGEERAKEGHKEYLSHYLKTHSRPPYDKMFDGIMETLNFLKEKGIDLYIVTSRAIESAILSLKFYGVEDMFKGIYAGDNTKNVKAEKLKEILLTTGYNGNEVYYVGDTASDVIESRKAGVKVISALWCNGFPKELAIAQNPDEYFYTVQDFYEFLRKNI